MAADAPRSPEPAGTHRLAPVRSETLSRQAYLAIRASILDGRLAPGEQLVESHLADQLGVSRGPVRDALRELVEDCLAVERPRAGTSVRDIGADDLVDIYNVRLAVEALAMRLCIRRRASTARLRELIAEMRAAAAANDANQVVERELRFHEQLCRESGSEQLLRMFHRLEGPVHLALAMDDATYASLADIAEEHLPIVDAIDAGDDRGAIAVIDEHVMSTIGVLVARRGGDPAELVRSP